jgi:hypothetical protein
MKRIHLFEWGDQPWLPRRFRGDLTELLRYQVSEVYQPAVPLLARWLRNGRCNSVVDLCSGAGGPWPALQEALSAEGIGVRVLLTDKYPSAVDTDLPADACHFHNHAVDALAMPADLEGGRTLFTSLHHFRPEQARSLLRQAVDHRTPIAVFEFTERKWSNVFGMLLSPLLIWLQTPFIRPFRWGRLLWTYLLPVTPLLYLWDGLVSHLRTYTLAELRGMLPAPPEPGYQWESGHLSAPDGGVTITYLMGWPS